MRAAARAAVDWATSAGNRTAVLIPDHPVNDPDWSLNGFGLAIGTGTPVGLAEGIARWLLGERSANVVAPGTDLSHYDCVLVMGEGSSARTEKAPGHLHPAAVGFDDQVLAALGSADAAALARLDGPLAAEVGASGAPVWQALGAAVQAVSTAHVDLAEDPYGVLYLVARWTVRWAAPA